MARRVKEKFAYAADTSGYVLALKDSHSDTATREKMTKVGHIMQLIITYAFLAVMGVIIIFPFYWMIITSLKSGAEIQREQQTYFPEFIMWSNYAEAASRLNFAVLIKNTLIVGVISTIGTLLTTILAAYAFARLTFKGRDTVFMVLLGSMMIPGEMMVISNYITVASFGWITSSTHTQTLTEAYAAMIVPFWVSVFHIYLLRQNFKQIPNELYLAAKVDGKSDWSYLWKVMVPLAAPTLISITILKFMGTWNSYVWPNLVTELPEYRLISNGLRESSFQNPDLNAIEYGYQMAASILVTVPLFLLFVFFRKYIMKGVGRAGIKG